MRYEVRFTNQFKKDLKLAQKQGKDTDKLFEVIEKLPLVPGRTGFGSFPILKSTIRVPLG